MKKIITLLGVMFFVVFVAACEAPPLSLLLVQAEQRSITLEVDERLQLLPVLEGFDTNGFLYDSDSILIASVSSTGVLIGLRPGIALIKVTSGDVVDYAKVIVIATTKDVVTGLCVTKEVIQDDDAQFVIVCEDGTTVATGITAPAVIESARIVLTEVSEDGELILTYADGEVVNVGNVVGPQGLRGFTSFSGGSVGPQGPVGDIGPQGLVGAKGDTGSSGADGSDGANGVVGETVATARDALDLTALLAVAMIDRIVFTSGIVYDSGVSLLYQETITMGDLYFNSGAYDTPTFTMSGLGTHIGDIYVDASSGTLVIGDKIRIVGDVFIQNVDINSFDTSANHEGRIIMLGRGRLNLDPLATVDALVIDSDQPVLLTGVFDAPITIVSANAQITLGEGVVLKELVIAETASNVTIQVESGVVVTGQGILLQGSAAEPVLSYDSGVTPQESLFPVTNQTTGINYYTIQSAIDAATSGDTIVVKSGTYVLPNGITINKPFLTLNALGTVHINYSDDPTAFSPNNSDGFFVLKDLGIVTVSGFSISGYENGITQTMSNATGTALQVINNLVNPGHRNGVPYLRNGIQVTGVGSIVRGNTVIGAPYNDDFLGVAISVVNASGVIIEGNNVTDTYYDIAISIRNYSSPVKVGNIIVRNNSISNAAEAFRISGLEGSSPNLVTDVTLENNTIIGPDNDTETIFGLKIFQVTVDNIVLNSNTFTFPSNPSQNVYVDASATASNVILDGTNLN